MKTTQFLKFLKLSNILNLFTESLESLDYLENLQKLPIPQKPLCFEQRFPNILNARSDTALFCQISIIVIVVIIGKEM